MPSESAVLPVMLPTWENAVSVKADNIVGGIGIAPYKLAVVYNKTVRYSSGTAAVRIVKATGIDAAYRAVLRRHLTQRKSYR